MRVSLRKGSTYARAKMWLHDREAGKWTMFSADPVRMCGIAKNYFCGKVWPFVLLTAVLLSVLTSGSVTCQTTIIALTDMGGDA
jgi:hypothetical protein